MSETDLNSEYASSMTARREQMAVDENRRRRIGDHVVVYKRRGMRKADVAPPLLSVTTQDRLDYLDSPTPATPEALGIDLINDRWATASTNGDGAVILHGNDDTLKALAHSELKKLMNLKTGERASLESMTPKAAKEFMAALES